MNKNAKKSSWLEIIRIAEERRCEWEKGIVRVPDLTLENLSPDTLDRFEHGKLYEFLPYRKNPGGEILFLCEKEPAIINGKQTHKTFFEEKFKIYRSEDIRGIEGREDPAYSRGMANSLYFKAPPGSSILDMGCGTAKYLIPANGAKMDILAFDLGKDMIDENKKSKGLDQISFFSGNCLELDFIPDREFDYVTAINLFNVLDKADVERILNESVRIAKKGIKLGFTLPSQSDKWTVMSREMEKNVAKGIGDPNAQVDIQEMAAQQSFTGQINMFCFLLEACDKRGWLIRIFRFLDRIRVNRDDFADTGFLYPGENAVLKFLELPQRKISSLEGFPENEILVHSVGYGAEIFFSGKEMPGPDNSLSYLKDRKEDLRKLSIKDEINHAIDFWELPFMRSD